MSSVAAVGDTLEMLLGMKDFQSRSNESLYTQDWLA